MDETTSLHASALSADKRDSALPGVALSVAFHLALVGAAWLSTRLEAPRVDLSAKPIQAKLVRLGEKRDERLLPRKESNAPPPQPEATPIPAKPTASTEPAKPQPRPRPAEKRDLTHDLFAAFDKNKAIAKADKAVGEADGDPNGDSDTASEGERYFGLMSARVRRGYDVSSAIADADRVRLSAVVVIWVDAAGTVTRSEFQQKSGNDLFDAAVLSAVQKAGPFPPPPDFLRTQLARDGVALKFRP